MRDGSWRESALCRQVDPALWFPEPGHPAEDARRICRVCPVVAERLEFAIVTAQTHGIWAGKNEHELRKARAARGLVKPTRRVPVDRVYALADRGWPLRLIAAEVGFPVDTVRKALKRRTRDEAAA